MYPIHADTHCEKALPSLQCLCEHICRIPHMAHTRDRWGKVIDRNLSPYVCAHCRTIDTSPLETCQCLAETTAKWQLTHTYT